MKGLSVSAIKGTPCGWANHGRGGLVGAGGAGKKED